jgi:hypothetical protein
MAESFAVSQWGVMFGNVSYGMERRLAHSRANVPSWLLIRCPRHSAAERRVDIWVLTAYEYRQYLSMKNEFEG